jgi:hypothetical protein
MTAISDTPIPSVEELHAQQQAASEEKTTASEPSAVGKVYGGKKVVEVIEVQGENTLCKMDDGTNVAVPNEYLK